MAHPFKIGTVQIGSHPYTEPGKLFPHVLLCLLFMPFSRMRPHTEIDMKLRNRILKIVGACGMLGTGFQGNAEAAQVNTMPRTSAEPQTAPPEEHTTVGWPCRTSPLVKNLMALNTPPRNRSAVRDPEHLSLKQLKERSRRASTAEDHAFIARQYRTEADRLDAVAANYAQAAATYAKGPMVKNLTAPTTSQRDAFTAQLLRKAAEGLRQRAASEDERASRAGIVVGLR
jgi:hypothetical protein